MSRPKDHEPSKDDLLRQIAWGQREFLRRRQRELEQERRQRRRERAAVQTAAAAREGADR